MGYQEPNVSPMSWIFLWGIKYTVNIIAGNMSMHWKKKEEKKKRTRKNAVAKYQVYRDSLSKAQTLHLVVSGQAEATHRVSAYCT